MLASTLPSVSNVIEDNIAASGTVALTTEPSAQIIGVYHSCREIRFSIIFKTYRLEYGINFV